MEFNAIELERLIAGTDGSEVVIPEGYTEIAEETFKGFEEKSKSSVLIHSQNPLKMLMLKSWEK